MANENYCHIIWDENKFVIKIVDGLGRKTLDFLQKFIGNNFIREGNFLRHLI